MSFRWPKFISSFSNENETDSDHNVRKSLSDPKKHIAPKVLFQTPLPKATPRTPTPARRAGQTVLTPQIRKRTPGASPKRPPKSPSGRIPVFTPGRTPRRRTPAKSPGTNKKDSVTMRYYRKERRVSPGVHKQRRNQALATPRGLRVTPRGGARATYSTVRIAGTPTVRRRFETQTPEFWLKEQAGALTAWANSVLAPEQPSRATPVGSYADSAVLAARITAMHRIFTSDRVQTAHSRLNDLIAGAQLFVARDVRFRSHVVDQDFVVHLLLVNYSPHWLYPALCVLFGLNFGAQVDQALEAARAAGGFHHDRAVMQALEDILRERLLNPDMLPLQNDPAMTPRTSKVHQARNEDNFNGTVLSYTFALVLLLDVAKQEHFKVIETDPPLFRTDSEMESSEDVIRRFSEKFLSSQGDVIRFLSYKSFHLSFSAPLAERITDLNVRDIFTDMRDGIRLCKLASIITKNPELMNQVQVTKTINDRDARTKSLRNVNAAMCKVLQYFNKGRDPPLHWAAKSHDIVSHGNREKTIALMHQFSDIWIRSVVLDKPLLASEVALTELAWKKTIADRKANAGGADWIPSDFNPSENAKVFMTDESVEKKLLHSWAAYVCAHYDVKVHEFTESFRDGLALCCLINYYRPDTLSLDNVVRVSSMGNRDADDLAREAVIVEQNFNLFYSAALELGGIPYFPISIRAATAPALTVGKDSAFGRLMYMITAYIFKRLVPEMRSGTDKENISSLLMRKVTPVEILHTPKRTPTSKKSEARTFNDDFTRSIAFTPKLTMLTPSKLMSDDVLSVDSGGVNQISLHPNKRVDANTDNMSSVSSAPRVTFAERESDLKSSEAEAVAIQAATRLYLSRRNTLALAAKRNRAATIIQRNWRAYSFRMHIEMGVEKRKSINESRQPLFGWGSIIVDIRKNTRRIFAQVESRLRAANHDGEELKRIEHESAALNVQRAVRRISSKTALASAESVEAKRESKSKAIAAAGLAVAGIAAAIAANEAYKNRISGILDIGEAAFQSVVRARSAEQFETQKLSLAALMALALRKQEFNQAARASLAADRAELNTLEQNLHSWDETHVDEDIDDDDDDNDSMLEDEQRAADASASADSAWNTSSKDFDAHIHQLDMLLKRANEAEKTARDYETLLAKKDSDLEKMELDAAAIAGQRSLRRLLAMKTAAKVSKLKQSAKNRAVSAAQAAASGMASLHAHRKFVEGSLRHAGSAYEAEINTRSSAQANIEAARYTALQAIEKKQTLSNEADQKSIAADQAELQALWKKLEQWEKTVAEKLVVSGDSGDEVVQNELDSSVANKAAEEAWKKSHESLQTDVKELEGSFKQAAEDNAASSYDEARLQERLSLLEERQKRLDQESDDALRKATVLHNARKAAAMGVEMSKEVLGVYKSTLLRLQSAGHSFSDCMKASNALEQMCAAGRKQQQQDLADNLHSLDASIKSSETELLNETLILEEEAELIDRKMDILTAVNLRATNRLLAEWEKLEAVQNDVDNIATSDRKESFSLSSAIVDTHEEASRYSSQFNELPKLRAEESELVMEKQAIGSSGLFAAKRPAHLERFGASPSIASGNDEAEGSTEESSESTHRSTDVSPVAATPESPAHAQTAFAGKTPRYFTELQSSYGVESGTKETETDTEDLSDEIRESSVSLSGVAQKQPIGVLSNNFPTILSEEETPVPSPTNPVSYRYFFSTGEAESANLESSPGPSPDGGHSKMNETETETEELSADTEESFVSLSGVAQKQQIGTLSTNSSMTPREEESAMPTPNKPVSYRYFFSADELENRSVESNRNDNFVPEEMSSIGHVPEKKPAHLSNPLVVTVVDESAVNHGTQTDVVPISDLGTQTGATTPLVHSSRTGQKKLTHSSPQPPSVSTGSISQTRSSRYAQEMSVSASSTLSKNMEKENSSQNIRSHVSEGNHASNDLRQTIFDQHRDVKAATSYVVETNRNICKTSADTMSIFNDMGGLLPAGARTAAGARSTDSPMDGRRLAQWESDFQRSLQTPDAKVLQAHAAACDARERAAEARSVGYGSMFDGEPGLLPALDAIATEFEQTPPVAGMTEAATAARMPAAIRRLSLMASSSSQVVCNRAEARRLREKEAARTGETMRMALLIVRGCSRRRGEARFVQQALALLIRLCAARHGAALLLAIPDSFDVLVTCAQFYREMEEVFAPCVRLLECAAQDPRLQAAMAKRTASARILAKLARFLSMRESQIVRTAEKLESANKLLEELARRGISIVEDPEPAGSEEVFSKEIRGWWKRLVAFNRSLNIESR